MAGEKQAYYFNGNERLNCQIVRLGANNARIVLDDGQYMLVPSESVEVIVSTSKRSPSRLIPTTPLESFYRPLRELKGTKASKFSVLKTRLESGYGPKGKDFLGELFQRSVTHAQFYENIDEPFYSKRVPRKRKPKDPFAISLVEQVARTGKVELKEHKIAFVEYEVFPFRTTYSCCENGEPASRTGAGGMDLLLASGNDCVLPAIGEIKAGSEQVGATFALIQSLTYAAQVLTCNQFKRLKKHYPIAFNEKLDDKNPRVDIVLLFEANKLPCLSDLDYAMEMADGLQKQFGDYLRQILFLQCALGRETHACTVLGRD